jgi:hypothetical protein
MDTVHRHGEGHGLAAPRHAEPATVSPSILRMSAFERLAVVAVVIVALWAAVHWAIS